MKTRVIVSALTVAALSLGSVSAFAQGDYSHDGRRQRTDQHRDDGRRFEQRQYAPGAWQRGADRGQYVQRVPAPAPAPAPDWHARREWREHQHRGYVQDYRSANRGYSYAQGGYYEQPGYYYQQPQYYGEYDDSGDAADIVFGAIVGGVIANAIVNSR